MLHWFCNETHLEGASIDQIREKRQVIIWSIDQKGVNKRLMELYEELDKSHIDCIFSSQEKEWGTVRDGIPVCRPTAGKDAVVISTLYDWKGVTEEARTLGYEKNYFFMTDEGMEKVALYRETFSEVEKINVIPSDRTFKYVHFIPDEKFFSGLAMFIEHGMDMNEHFFVVYNMYRRQQNALYGVWNEYKRVMKQYRNMYLVCGVRPMCFDTWDDNVENLDRLLECAEKIFFHSEHEPREREISYLSGKIKEISEKGYYIPWCTMYEHAGLLKRYMTDVIQYVKVFIVRLDETRDAYYGRYPGLKMARREVESPSYHIPILRAQNKKMHRNILVGHCAWHYNYVVDTLERLSLIDDSFRVYAITSYGDEVERIERAGTRIFGERFTSVRKFMPYEEFVDFIEQMDVAVFGMETLYGVGTLHALFLTGAKVYMKPGTEAANWAVRNGYHIEDYNSVQQLSAEQLLENPYREENSAVARKFFDLDAKVERWKSIFEEAL